MEAPTTGDLRSQLLGNTQSDGAVFKTVLFYSVLILLLPIGCFFTTKSIIFETILGQESTIGTNIVSAVVAVIVLHLALGLFIYKVRTTNTSLELTKLCITGVLRQRQEGNKVGLKGFRGLDIRIVIPSSDLLLLLLLIKVLL